MTDTSTTTARGHEARVEEYVRFWNASEREEQQRLAGAVFTEEVSYRAPVGLRTGARELAEFREEFAAHAGTYTFRPLRAPEIHHDRARLHWELDVGGTQGFAAGTDVLAFGVDGRISEVSTFLDRAPEGFDPEAHA